MKIRAADTRLLRYRLDRPVGGSGVASVEVIVATIALDNGIAGLCFSYVLSGSSGAAIAAAGQLANLLEGTVIDHPEAVWRRLAASFNRTRRGPNYVGLAALDVAVWDAYAKSLGVPLGVAMGGAARALPVYGSGGFNAQQSPDEAAAAARAHADRGFRAVKPRVAGRRDDEAVIRAVAEAVPRATHVMLDANEKCTASAARHLLERAREHGVLFVEEPLPADDLPGFRALARDFSGLLATGEHLQGTAEALPYIAERLCAVMQPDLAAMGGLTECLRVARLAEPFGVEISPHFLPGLFIHLAAAAPNVTWLEDFPLIEPLFSGWPEMSADGTLTLPSAPGHGLALGCVARLRYALNSGVRQSPRASPVRSPLSSP